MAKLSVIIVNYNTQEFLQKCLANLGGIGLDMEVIVVDNGSTDESLRMVKEHFPKVILVKTDNNGLAAGSNLGFEKASGEYVLYLGSDAFPSEETLEGLTTYFEDHSDVGVATAKLVLEDGLMDWDCHRGFPTPWASLTHFSKLNKLFPKSFLFNQYFLGFKNLDEPHEIDLCIAHFMFVRRKALEDVGRWDEDFFVFGEDVDFCYRIKEKGWKIMFLPQWEVPHIKGVGIGIRKTSQSISKASSETKKRMREETTRAMRLFYEKHYTDKYPKLVTQVVLWGISFLSWLRTIGK